MSKGWCDFCCEKRDKKFLEKAHRCESCKTVEYFNTEHLRDLFYDFSRTIESVESDDILNFIEWLEK